MPLAPVDGLARAAPDLWRSLGACLRRIGLDGSSAEELRARGEGLFALLRMPIGRWHARQVPEPYAHALRVFELADAISESEAHDSFGRELTRDLLEAGLFMECGAGRIGCPFRLSRFWGLFLISDPLRPGGAAVMGPGGTTVTAASGARPPRPVRRLLEVGCGAGSCALLFAGMAQTVVATDVNPRALALTRVNALMNNVDNLELREGDLFEPVRDEQFDWIVAQPPYLPHPPEAADALYLFGGPRGDELPLRLLQGAPARLSLGGRAAVLADWPELADEPIDQRIASALDGQSLGVLMLHGPPESADNLAAVYAAAHCDSLDSRLDHDFDLWRDHLARMKIERVHPTLNLVERLAPGEKSWSGNHYVLQWSLLNAAAADRLFANRKPLARGDDALLRAKLRLPQRARVARESDDADGQEVWRVLCPPETLLAEMEAEAATCDVLQAVGGSPTVGEALAEHAGRVGESEFLNVARSWIESGVLGADDREESGR